MRRDRGGKRVFVRTCAGLCLAALIFLGAGCGGARDVALARRIFHQLVKGHYAARHSIDWERLEALGVSVGDEYTGYEREEDRLNFQRAFIENFSKGFLSQGIDLKVFTDWRVLEKGKEEGAITFVAADIKGQPQVLVLGIERSGRKRKLTRILVGTLLVPEASQASAGPERETGNGQ